MDSFVDNVQRGENATAGVSLMNDASLVVKSAKCNGVKKMNNTRRMNASVVKLATGRKRIALNTSLLRSNLKANNKALAQALELSKGELKAERERVVQMQAENHVLRLEVSRLSKLMDVDGRENEVTARVAEKMTAVRQLIRELSGRLIESADVLQRLQGFCSGYDASSADIGERHSGISMVSTRDSESVSEPTEPRENTIYGRHRRPVSGLPQPLGEIENSSAQDSESVVASEQSCREVTRFKAPSQGATVPLDLSTVMETSVMVDDMLTDARTDDVDVLETVAEEAVERPSRSRSHTHQNPGAHVFRKSRTSSLLGRAGDGVSLAALAGIQMPHPAASLDSITSDGTADGSRDVSANTESMPDEPKQVVETQTKENAVVSDSSVESCNRRLTRSRRQTVEQVVAAVTFEAGTNAAGVSGLEGKSIDRDGKNLATERGKGSINARRETFVVSHSEKWNTAERSVIPKLKAVHDEQRVNTTEKRRETFVVPIAPTASAAVQPGTISLPSNGSDDTVFVKRQEESKTKLEGTNSCTELTTTAISDEKDVLVADRIVAFEATALSSSLTTKAMHPPNAVASKRKESLKQGKKQSKQSTGQPLRPKVVHTPVKVAPENSVFAQPQVVRTGSSPEIRPMQAALYRMIYLDGKTPEKLPHMSNRASASNLVDGATTSEHTVVYNDHGDDMEMTNLDVAGVQDSSPLQASDALVAVTGNGSEAVTEHNFSISCGITQNRQKVAEVLINVEDIGPVLELTPKTKTGAIDVAAFKEMNKRRISECEGVPQGSAKKRDSSPALGHKKRRQTRPLHFYDDDEDEDKDECQVNGSDDSDYIELPKKKRTKSKTLPAIIKQNNNLPVRRTQGRGRRNAALDDMADTSKITNEPIEVDKLKALVADVVSTTGQVNHSGAEKRNTLVESALIIKQEFEDSTSGGCEAASTTRNAGKSLSKMPVIPKLSSSKPRRGTGGASTSRDVGVDSFAASDAPSLVGDGQEGASREPSVASMVGSTDEVNELAGRRGRRAAAAVSYKEPSLNKKLRRDV